MPLQIYAMIADLKVREHSIGYLRNDTKLHQANTEIQAIQIYYRNYQTWRQRKDAKDIKRNPKRMQREAKKQMQETGIGTKSQQALKLQQEQNKQERKVRSREKKEADELRMFELKQQNCGYRWVL